jgi:hypothetical protein
VKTRLASADLALPLATRGIRFTNSWDPEASHGGGLRESPFWNSKCSLARYVVAKHEGKPQCQARFSNDEGPLTTIPACLTPSKREYCNRTSPAA